VSRPLTERPATNTQRTACACDQRYLASFRFPDLDHHRPSPLLPGGSAPVSPALGDRPLQEENTGKFVYSQPRRSAGYARPSHNFSKSRSGRRTAGVRAVIKTSRAVGPHSNSGTTGLQPGGPYIYASADLGSISASAAICMSALTRSTRWRCEGMQQRSQFAAGPYVLAVERAAGGGCQAYFRDLESSAPVIALAHRPTGRFAVRARRRAAAVGLAWAVRRAPATRASYPRRFGGHRLTRRDTTP